MVSGALTLKQRARAAIEYTIKEASELTGFGQAALRAWERRYGWPRVKRGRNLYRAYTGSDIQEMLFVKKALEQGQKLTDLIDADGNVRGLHQARSTPELKMPPLQTPATRAGSDWQRILRKAFHCNDIAAAHAALAAVPTIHPVDRAPAVWRVIAVWLLFLKPTRLFSRQAGQLENALRESAGNDFIAVLDDAEKATGTGRYAPTGSQRTSAANHSAAGGLDACCCHGNHQAHQTCA